MLGGEKNGNIEKEYSSIHQELNRFLVFVIIIFAILCAFTYGCVRRILTAPHEMNTWKLARRQMEYEMNSVYDKAENYLISLAAIDERTCSNYSGNQNERRPWTLIMCRSRSSRLQNLEPAIKDIAFVNGNTTYSTIYSREELYELADKTTWNGYCLVRH